MSILNHKTVKVLALKMLGFLFCFVFLRFQKVILPNKNLEDTQKMIGNEYFTRYHNAVTDL